MTVAGSDSCVLDQGRYRARLEHVAGTNLQIDAVAFRDTESGRFILEAEDFGAFADTGGETIRKLPVLGCSSGYILFGLDTAGEWTEYEIVIAAAGTYRLTMTCRGGFNVSYAFRLVFTKAIDPENVTWGVVKNLYE